MKRDKPCIRKSWPVGSWDVIRDSHTGGWLFMVYTTNHKWECFGTFGTREAAMQRMRACSAF